MDTGVWIALLWQRDRAHEAVRRHFLRVREEGADLVTSDPVIGEAATRLRYDASSGAVGKFRRVLEQAVVASTLRVRESDGKLRRRGFEIIEQYADLRLSYADGIGAAVTEEIGADAVFGLDHHFRILGHALEP